MSEERFELLYELLLDDPSCSESKANCSTEQGLIPPRAHLSCTLRWLAGCFYPDLILIHLMGKSEFYDSLKATLIATNTHPELKMEFPLGDNERLEAIASGFAAVLPGGSNITRAAGAADGFEAQVHVPRRSLPGANPP